MPFTPISDVPRKIEPFRLLQEAVSEAGPIYLPMLIMMSPMIVLPAMRYAPDLAIISGLVDAFIVTPISSAVIYFVYCYIQNGTIDIPGAFAQTLSQFSNIFVGFLLTVTSVAVGFIGFILPGIYMTVQLSLVLYAITIEGHSGIDGMNASWRLVKGRWWPVFGSVMIPQLFLIIPIVAVRGIAGVPFGEDGPPIVSISEAVIGILVSPIPSFYFVKLYLRLKAIAAA